MIVKEEMTLLDYLLRSESRKNAKNYLKFKQVYVNNQCITQFDTIVKVGDQIEIHKDKTNTSLDIIYEDEEFIVINKPSGMLSMSDGKEKEKTAYHLVSEYAKSKNHNNRIFIVHRLDQDTSGVLMFAKNEKIKLQLQEHWNDIVTKRGYIAIVEGKSKPKDTIITFLQENKTKQVYVAKTGKKAITHYKTLKQSRGYSLLEVYLDTGRKNQIRVHMQYLHMPIAGDKKYGAKTNPIRRLALHSHILEFKHPVNHKVYTFKADAPATFYKLFNH